jgi:Asp-tRNA(Asn)/Glu-tRNA(Gln) amidotransferase A subunit family amidase
VTLPLLSSEDGLPIGAQLVGRRGNDARLLRTARWLAKTLQPGGRRRPAKERAGPRSAKKG